MSTSNTGVTGIGEVNAVQLITEFGSLEELLSNVDKMQQGHIKEVQVLLTAMIKASKSDICMLIG